MSDIPSVWGGFCHFPDHPLADLHGVVRFCIRTTSPYRVRDALAKYGVDLNPREIHKTWGASKSHTEAAVTRLNFGEVYFCSVVHSYLDISVYRHDRSLTVAMRQETSRIAHAEGSRVKASGRTNRKVEFP